MRGPNAAKCLLRFERLLRWDRPVRAGHRGGGTRGAPRLPVIDIHQVRDGKIVAHWRVSDMAAVMGQTGQATDSS